MSLFPAAALLSSGLALAFGSSTSEPVPAPPATQPGPPPSVSKRGVLDRETVRYYISLKQPAVRHCYERELGRHPDWRTAVTVEFSVDPTGRISACKLGQRDIEQCVARVICTIRFPYVFDTLSNGETRVGSDTTHVRYRFRFQPRRREGDRGQERYRRRAARPVSPGQPAPTPKPIPGARPAAAPPAPQPTTAPAPPPGQPAKPAKPRIKTPNGNDPLEGIDRSNPL